MEGKQLFRLEKLAPVLKKYRYALLVVLAGVLLMSLGSGPGRAERAAPTWQEEAGFDLAAMEQKLEKTLSQVSGAGRVSVVLSLKESVRRVLAQDARVTDNEQSRTAVLISQGSGVQQPVQVQCQWPRYQGALVVCDGADSPEVCLALTQAVRAVTGLSAERISICKRQ